MLSDHAPPDRVAAATIRLQTGIAAAGIPLFGGYDRAIFFLLVLRRFLGRQADAGGRPISIHAIATSVDRPYATVWRQIHGLREAGLLLVEGRGVTVADGALDRVDIRRFLQSVVDGFAAMSADLARAGLLHLPPRAAMDDQRLLMGAIDLLLCTVESECKTDWVDLLLIGYLESGAARDADPDADGEDDGVSVAGGGTINLRRMARDMAMPYTTVHRRTRAMVDGGLLERRGGGVEVAAPWGMSGAGQVRARAAVDCARKVYGRLATG